MTSLIARLCDTLAAGGIRIASGHMADRAGYFDATKRVIVLDPGAPLDDLEIGLDHALAVLAAPGDLVPGAASVRPVLALVHSVEIPETPVIDRAGARARLRVVG